MRKLYKPVTSSTTNAAKRMSIEHNVSIRVLDETTHAVIQEHTGHNAATNTLLTGIAHYLIGDGVYNQGYDMLSRFVPRYISLGTMGLLNQEEDELHLPKGLGGIDDDPEENEYYSETTRLCHYIAECPGFGADGYDANENMNRPYFGLGPVYDRRESKLTINCELINTAYPRSEISFRDIVPEAEAEIPKTVDVILSAMISTGALNKFREPGRGYVYITEAGLWSRRDYSEGGDNGLLAGYRIVPPNQSQWDLGTYFEGEYDDEGNVIIPPHYELDPDNADHAAMQLKNQEVLKKNVLRVGPNQVVQVIWKIQVGGLDQLGGMQELYPSLAQTGVWHLWDELD